MYLIPTDKEQKWSYIQYKCSSKRFRMANVKFKIKLNYVLALIKLELLIESKVKFYKFLQFIGPYNFAVLSNFHS